MTQSSDRTLQKGHNLGIYGQVPARLFHQPLDPPILSPAR